MGNASRCWLPKERPKQGDAAVDVVAAEPLKKRKKESRILREAKRELAEERARAQGAASASAAPSGSALQTQQDHSAQQQPVKQPKPSAAENGLHASGSKAGKARPVQAATGASTSAETGALQEARRERSSGAKPGKKKAKNSGAIELGGAAGQVSEQPMHKAKKLAKLGKQKGKKSKAPHPATGKLLEGAIAMLAARAPKQAQR